MALYSVADRTLRSAIGECLRSRVRRIIAPKLPGTDYDSPVNEFRPCTVDRPSEDLPTQHLRLTVGQGSRDRLSKEISETARVDLVSRGTSTGEQAGGAH